MEKYKCVVSIVIPVFNNSSQIRETLLSIVVQTSKKWEVICVDDGSDDVTCDIIREFSSKYPNIHLIVRENLPKGASHCRNIGLNNAKGEYVIFLDGDDLLAPYCIEQRLAKIEKTNFNFVVFPNAVIKNGKIGPITSDKNIRRPKLAYAANHAVWQTTCPIYKTEFVRSLGGFNENYPRMQDVEFNLRCLVASGNNYLNLLSTAVEDCYYRLYNNNVTQKKYDKTYAALPLFTKLIKDLNEQKDFKPSEFSHICFCLYCSMVMIRYNTSNRTSFEGLISFDMIKEMKCVDKFAYFIVKVFSFNEKLCYHVAHILRFIFIHLFF